MGNLVTSNKALEQLSLNMYTERLKSHNIKESLKLHKVQQENIWDERFKEAQKNLTPDWTMGDLEVVLQQLKNKKSRDPLGLANELFKPNNAGKDLKLALLKLSNQIKKQQIFPEALGLSNITSLYKNKGSKKDFNNYRGIFRVTIIRSIIDKLIYNDEYETIDENLTDSNVGARRNRNIRDNIFVINAITNNIRKNHIKDTDIHIYDAEKCFDKLWAKECFNDVYENGLKSDKLALLYNINKDAKVAIKTSNGISKRITIQDTIMQGTVWASLICTSTIDTLGKQCYKSPEALYQYKGVPIPPLGMVDDILCVTNVERSKEMNSVVNTFIESKKLRLSGTKCFQIHIGKGHLNCPKFKVHESDMKTADREKYLGDIIDKDGRIQATIESRKSKGQGITTGIMSIIDEIPLGKHRVDVAFKLREVMLLNGILFNSEAWHGVTKPQIRELEKIDENLIRRILKAHSKTPLEFLYLESGTISIKWILAQRRVNYLKTILEKDGNELVRKVFEAQKLNPNNGDFVKLVEQDMLDLGTTYEEIACKNKADIKKILKTNARNACFKELKTKLLGHRKVKHLEYKTFEIQPYLRSKHLHPEEAQTITALRSKCVKSVKSNFSAMHKNRIHCPLKCNIENPQIDTQDHLLSCSSVKVENPLQVTIQSTYSDITQQEAIGKLICNILKKRRKLLECIEKEKHTKNIK